MRRTSVSLPTKQVAQDPYEKRARYTPQDLGFFARVKAVWMSQAQKTRWVKTAAIVFVVLVFFYWVSPKGVDIYNDAGSTSPAAVGKGQVPSDASYGSDECTQSSSPSKPIVQYVLMVDAGSTGSRIHVYKFNNCGPTPKLEHEEFEMTEKEVGGLSKYKDDPEAAARTLGPLMDVAMKTVPDALKSCSPIAVKATAGLRMIGKEKADNILDAVRNNLETKYPFPVVSKEKGGVAMMDGSDEGVYAWITANYLLGKIGTSEKTPTAAVFDLGGGSTQIVFEPTFQDALEGAIPDTLADGEHKYELSFGGREFTLYQHSHLGYGLMAARESIHRTLVEEIYEDKKLTGDWHKKPVINPCITPDSTTEVEVKLGDGHPLGASAIFNMTGPSSPSPALCRNLAEKILMKEAECALAPCSFNGIHQPKLSKTFPKEEVYAFSYFYDRTKPLGMPDSFTLREMHDLTSTVCAGEPGWDVFSTVPGALEELRDRPESCLDLSFMLALLHTGYDMPIDREVKIAKKIAKNELGWCLGASLPYLAPASGWECKITEVF